MFAITAKRLLRGRSSFVLTEVVTATFVAMFVFLGAVSIYTITWQWWHETAPLIDAQRVARTAISAIVDGYEDSLVGQDNNFVRRYGIAWAVYDPVISGSLGSDDKISFGLEQEKDTFDDYPAVHNVRSFYLGTDASSGLKAVYYRNSSGAVKLMPATLGITGLKFEKSTDVNGRIYVKVIATVEKDIPGTRNVPFHIKVQYADYAYLRNYR